MYILRISRVLKVTSPPQPESNINPEHEITPPPHPQTSCRRTAHGATGPYFYTAILKIATATLLLSYCPIVLGKCPHPSPHFAPFGPSSLPVPSRTRCAQNYLPRPRDPLSSCILLANPHAPSKKIPAAIPPTPSSYLKSF